MQPGPRPTTRATVLIAGGLALLVAALVTVLVLAVLSWPDGEDPRPPSPPSTPATPGPVPLATLTGAPSLPVEAPELPVPEGAQAWQVDWLVGQLLPAARRSLDVARLSQGTEAEAATWVLAPLDGSRRTDRARRLRMAHGRGYAFLLGHRFAPDTPPTGAVHVLGQAWRTSAEAGVLSVGVTLESAVPFAEGVAVVRRSLELFAPVTVREGGRHLPGYRYRVRTLGIDACAVLTEGAARPGDLAEVGAEVEALTAREEPGGLSRWARAGVPLVDPAQQRRACRE